MLIKGRKAVIFCLVLIGFMLFSQNLQAKTKVSSQEIWWALGHPFVAAKAKKISNRAIQITDSMENAGVLKDRSGGQLDAFKHALWMAMMSQHIKVKKLRKLGLAHERFNYRQAKKGKGGGDKVASDMDLWNNEVGLKIGGANKTLTESELIDMLIKAVNQGEMRIIKKNRQGEFLNLDGQLIDNSTLKTWVNKRCLVPSDYRYN